MDPNELDTPRCFHLDDHRIRGRERNRSGPRAGERLHTDLSGVPERPDVSRVIEDQVPGQVALHGNCSDTVCRDARQAPVELACTEVEDSAVAAEHQIPGRTRDDPDDLRCERDAGKNLRNRTVVVRCTESERTAVPGH